MKPAIRISHEGEGIKVEVLQPKVLTHHGFGSFLEMPKKGAVTITKKAMAILQAAPCRRGLMGFEIFRGPIVSWADPEDLIIDKLEAISVADADTKAAIKKLFIIE